MSEFKRIFTPRTEKAVKAISLLLNGSRYAPTKKEKDNTLAVLKDAVNDVAQVYGMLPNDKVVSQDTEPTTAEGRSEASIAARKEVIKKSAFAHENVDANVRSIPENQLTSYVTHIMARMCGEYEEKG